MNLQRICSQRLV